MVEETKRSITNKVLVQLCNPSPTPAQYTDQSICKLTLILYGLSSWLINSRKSRKI